VKIRLQSAMTRCSARSAPSGVAKLDATGAPLTEGVLQASRPEVKCGTIEPGAGLAPSLPGRLAGDPPAQPRPARAAPPGAPQPLGSEAPARAPRLGRSPTTRTQPVPATPLSSRSGESALPKCLLGWRRWWPVADHAEVLLDGFDPLGRNARPVGWWLEPWPLRRLGERLYVFLDSGGCAEEQHLRGV